MTQRRTRLRCRAASPRGGAWVQCHLSRGPWARGVLQRAAAMQQPFHHRGASWGGEPGGALCYREGLGPVLLRLQARQPVRSQGAAALAATRGKAYSLVAALRCQPKGDDGTIGSQLIGSRRVSASTGADGPLPPVLWSKVGGLVKSGVILAVNPQASFLRGRAAAPAYLFYWGFLHFYL